MPLTFPSHAAAVVPLLRVGAFFPVALVIGSCAPDLGFLVGVPAPSALAEYFHSLPGMAVLGMPLALLLWVWFERVVCPVLRQIAPVAMGVNWAGLFHTRGLPSTAWGWLGGVASLLVGGATHLLWDGFTHTYRWPASMLYPEWVLFVWEGKPVGLAATLQMVSHFLGLGVTARVVWKRFGGQPTSRAPDRGRPLLVLVGCVLGGMVVSALSLLLFPHWEVRAPFGWPWALFWSGTRGVLLGVTVGCVLLGARRFRGLRA